MGAPFIAATHHFSNFHVFMTLPVQVSPYGTLLLHLTPTLGGADQLTSRVTLQGERGGIEGGRGEGEKDYYLCIRVVWLYH